MRHTPFLSLFPSFPGQRFFAAAQRHPRKIPARLRAALAGLLLLLPALAAAAPFAYIANRGSNTVSVINTTTNIVTATVPVGNDPYGVAVNPAGTRVYVTNQNSDNVSVINTATNTVSATIPVGRYPYGVAVNPAGTRVYVVNQDSHNVSVIDTASNSVIATVGVEIAPRGVAVNPAGTRVYVTTQGGFASVIDTASNSVIKTLDVGPYATGVAVNPAGTHVYVTSLWNNTVSVIDTTSNSVIHTVGVGNEPIGVAVNPDGTRVYVANYARHNVSHNVSVIDTATNSVTATVAVGSWPRGVAVNPTGTRVYVTNSDSDTVSVIDTTSNSVIDTVEVGSNPASLGQFIGELPYATTPDAFSFTARFGVNPGAVVKSNAITVSGINVAAPISIIGGSYSINGGAYTTTTSTVNNNDTVTVRQTASGDFSTLTTATLTIGSFSDVFQVTTAAPDTTPDAFSFTARFGVNPGAVVESNTIMVTGLDSAAPISITGGSYSISGGAYTTTTGAVNNGDTVTVQQTASGDFSTLTTATLTIGGVSGTFQVTTLNLAVSSIIVDPAAPAILYTGLDDAGVYKSTDGGASWTAATTQPANTRVKELVIKPGDSTVLFAATYGGGIFSSSDSGVNWSACATQPGNLNLLSLTMDAAGKLYAGSEAGVFVSSDSCTSWTAMNAGLPL